MLNAPTLRISRAIVGGRLEGRAISPKSVQTKFTAIRGGRQTERPIAKCENAAFVKGA
jgi:hypothetical protein